MGPICLSYWSAEDDIGTSHFHFSLSRFCWRATLPILHQSYKNFEYR